MSARALAGTVFLAAVAFGVLLMLVLGRTRAEAILRAILSFIVPGTPP